MSKLTLTHLDELEAESIHIIREVAAEFDNPVMLYSIGKDSAVMLHLARKAFFPGKLPFPLLSDFPERKAIRSYGVLNEKAMVANRSVVLTSPPHCLTIQARGKYQPEIASVSCLPCP